MTQILPVVPAYKLAIQTDDARWLVRLVWGLGAVGMIAGSAKLWCAFSYVE